MQPFLDREPSTAQTLLEQVREFGAEDAWKTFVDRYAPFLHCVLRRLGVPDEDAADLVQDTFLTIVTHIGDFQYDPGKRFRGWLTTMATRKAYRYFQKRGRQVAWPDERFDVAQEIIDEEWYRRRLALACQRAKDEVSEVEWRAFEKTVLENESNQEAAQSLGITIGYLFVCKCKAKAVFLRALEETDE